MNGNLVVNEPNVNMDPKEISIKDTSEDNVCANDDNECLNNDITVNIANGGEVKNIQNNDMDKEEKVNGKDIEVCFDLLSTNAQNVISKLQMDYRSSSETDSCDSESDSSSSEESDKSKGDDEEEEEEEEEEDDDDDDDEDDNDHEEEEEDDGDGEGKTKKKEMKPPKVKGEMQLQDLPPIEELCISLPEDKCQEVGRISNIVDTLVVVEAYKNTPALNLDTVLFLEKGKCALGAIFDVLGPVSEPVYSIRFNSPEEIIKKGITKGILVDYAPTTDYSSFVFVKELMKLKGSDASWEHNVEASPDVALEFSDDEEERKAMMRLNATTVHISITYYDQ